MYYDCNIADVLHYRHEFSQMFHSISKVIFYNNTQYVRRKQRSHMEVISGQYSEHMLPLIMQLFPEVHVLYEDDVLPVDLLQSSSGHRKGGKLDTRLVVPGRVY
jgi:hypothetical protein